MQMARSHVLHTRRPPYSDPFRAGQSDPFRAGTLSVEPELEHNTDSDELPAHQAGQLQDNSSSDGEIVRVAEPVQHAARDVADEAAVGSSDPAAAGESESSSTERFTDARSEGLAALDEEYQQRTLWVSNIPPNHKGHSSLVKAFRQFGTVLTGTFGRKPDHDEEEGAGTGRSFHHAGDSFRRSRSLAQAKATKTNWAFVTFATTSAIDVMSAINDTVIELADGTGPTHQVLHCEAFDAGRLTDNPSDSFKTAWRRHCDKVVAASTAAENKWPTAAEYCAHGISAAGMQWFLDKYGKGGRFDGVEIPEITEEMTTSDVNREIVKPLTVVEGWTCKATLKNEEKGHYNHTYVSSETGEETAFAPAGEWGGEKCLGTRSLLEKLMENEEVREAEFIDTPNVFFSHAWRYSFKQVVEAMQAFQKRQPIDPTTKKPLTLYFWYDCFSMNEHKQVEPLPLEFWSGSFRDAISFIGRTCMMLSPWDKPTALTRGWCLWELLCTVDVGVQFDVCMGATDRRNFREQLLNDEMHTNGQMHTSDALVHAFEAIDLKHAEGRPEDIEMITAAARSVAGGLDGLNEQAVEKMRERLVAIAMETVQHERDENANGKLVSNQAQHISLAVAHLLVGVDQDWTIDAATKLQTEAVDAMTNDLGKDDISTLIPQADLIEMEFKRKMHDMLAKLSNTASKPSWVNRTLPVTPRIQSSAYPAFETHIQQLTDLLKKVETLETGAYAEAASAAGDKVAVQRTEAAENPAMHSKAAEEFRHTRRHVRKCLARVLSDTAANVHGKEDLFQEAVQVQGRVEQELLEKYDEDPTNPELLLHFGCMAKTIHAQATHGGIGRFSEYENILEDALCLFITIHRRLEQRKTRADHCEINLEAHRLEASHNLANTMRAIAERETNDGNDLSSDYDETDLTPNFDVSVYGAAENDANKQIPKIHGLKGSESSRFQQLINFLVDAKQRLEEVKRNDGKVYGHKTHRFKEAKHDLVKLEETVAKVLTNAHQTNVKRLKRINNHAILCNPDKMPSFSGIAKKIQELESELQRLTNVLPYFQKLGSIEVLREDCRVADAERMSMIKQFGKDNYELMGMQDKDLGDSDMKRVIEEKIKRCHEQVRVALESHNRVDEACGKSFYEATCHHHLVTADKPPMDGWGPSEHGTLEYVPTFRQSPEGNVIIVKGFMPAGPENSVCFEPLQKFMEGGKPTYWNVGHHKGRYKIQWMESQKLWSLRKPAKHDMGFAHWFGKWDGHELPAGFVEMVQHIGKAQTDRREAEKAIAGLKHTPFELSQQELHVLEEICPAKKREEFDDVKTDMLHEYGLDEDDYQAILNSEWPKVLHKFRERYDLERQQQIGTGTVPQCCMIS